MVPDRGELDAVRDSAVPLITSTPVTRYQDARVAATGNEALPATLPADET